MRGDSKVTSSVALLLSVLIVAAIIGYIAYSEDGAFKETVEVGTEGIEKAKEIKQLLELPPQEQF